MSKINKLSWNDINNLDVTTIALTLTMVYTCHARWWIYVCWKMVILSLYSGVQDKYSTNNTDWNIHQWPCEMKPSWCTIYYWYVYRSLHVAGVCVPIIREYNCVCATLHACYSVWVTVWCVGWNESSFISPCIHTE